MTTAARRRSALSPRRAVLLGTGISIVVVLAIHLLARAAGDEMVVTPPGRSAGPVPVGAAIGATMVAGLFAWLLAIVVGRLSAPRRWFVVVAVAGLLLSFSSPFGAAEELSTALWLSAMHVAIALILVPLTVRALPAGAR